MKTPNSFLPTISSPPPAYQTEQQRWLPGWPGSLRIARIEDGSHYLDRTTNSNGEILISDLGLAFIPCVNCPLCRITSRTIPSTM